MVSNIADSSNAGFMVADSTNASACAEISANLLLDVLLRPLDVLLGVDLVGPQIGHARNRYRLAIAVLVEHTAQAVHRIGGREEGALALLGEVDRGRARHHRLAHAAFSSEEEVLEGRHGPQVVGE
jgi:hypothetical protein